ncbi:MAG: hypothetical protein AAF587_37755 [Bacteroidota bacterium]
MFDLILLLNAIWFAMGFYAFAVRSKIFAKTLVAREHRDTPVFDMFAETGKFLGGFNAAFCVLNVLVLINPAVFPEAGQRIILCATFAIAHGSQFLPNAFIALDNQKGTGVWQVKGRMRFIFITDLVLMLANIAIVVIYSC